MEKTVENSTNMAEDPAGSSPAGLSPQGGSRLSPPAKTDEGEVTSQTSQPSPGQGMEDALIEMIEQEVSKRFQSAKDKRWTQLEKQYGDLSELREMVAELLEKSPAPPAAPGEETSLADRVAALGEYPGLKAHNTARTMLSARGAPQDLTSYTQLLEDLLMVTHGVKDGSLPTPVTPATAVTPGGSNAAGDLWQAYQRRKRQLRPGDVNALTALKREFRNKGLNVF